MSIYLVDVHHTTHTCPADPTPHVVDTRRTVVHVTQGGPCRAPVTIRCGDTVATIDCGRHEPAHRQCGACRTTAVEHTITAVHAGPAPTHHAAPATPARHICDACRQPLAAVLAHLGRHLLCQPHAATPTGRAA